MQVSQLVSQSESASPSPSTSPLPHDSAGQQVASPQIIAGAVIGATVTALLLGVLWATVLGFNPFNWTRGIVLTSKQLPHAAPRARVFDYGISSAHANATQALPAESAETVAGLKDPSVVMVSNPATTVPVSTVKTGFGPILR